MSKKELVKVNCKTCNLVLEKVKDSLRRWSGNCRSCAKSNRDIKKSFDTHKKCQMCKLILPKNEEFFNFNSKGFAYSYCRQCKAQWLSKKRIPSARKKLTKEELNTRAKQRNKEKIINEWHKVLFATAKSNSARYNRDFNLKLDDILELYENQNGLCYWFKVPLVPSDQNRFPQKPSLDRLDCEKGYVKGNVVLSCMAANIGRSNCDALVFQEFCKLLHTI